MKRQTKSILQELNDMASKPPVENVVDSRAVHVIESAINVLNMIKTNLNENTATDLEKRFINSIRTGDPKKFQRGISNYKKGKDTDAL
mgnify:FL=1